MVIFLTTVPLAAGLWADRRLETAPWLTLAGMLTGVMASTTGIWRIIRGKYAELERRHGRTDDDIKGADA
jgi:F0F1-type ATP synthase assembly protein I